MGRFLLYGCLRGLVPKAAHATLSVVRSPCAGAGTALGAGFVVVDDVVVLLLVGIEIEGVRRRRDQISKRVSKQATGYINA